MARMVKEVGFSYHQWSTTSTSYDWLDVNFTSLLGNDATAWNQITN
jgi:hypothetical protein